VRQLFDNTMNTATVVNSDGSSQKFFFDCDSDDTLWKKLEGMEFPVASEELGKEVHRYKKESGKPHDIDVDDSEESRFKMLKAAERASKLQEWKKLLDLHSTALTAILDRIKKREIHEFYTKGHELLLCMGNSLPSSELTRNVRDLVVTKPPAAAAPEEAKNEGLLTDKLALYLMWLLANNADSLAGTNANASREMEASLLEQGVPLSTLNYVKRIKTFNEHVRSASPVTPRRNNSEKSSSFSGVVKKLTKTEPRPRAVHAFESMMNNYSFDEEQSFIYLDPKYQGNSASVPRKSSPYRDGIFFMVGGGSYAEYEELRQLCTPSEDGTNKRVIYGATEMFTPEDFLSTISLLP